LVNQFYFVDALPDLGGEVGFVWEGRSWAVEVDMNGVELIPLQAVEDIASAEPEWDDPYILSPMCPYPTEWKRFVEAFPKTLKIDGT